MHLTVNGYTYLIPKSSSPTTFTQYTNTIVPQKLRSTCCYCNASPNDEEPKNICLPEKDESNSDEIRRSRRQTLRTMALASVVLPSTPALAGIAEYDKSTGELYTPKAEMLRGGSAAARGRIIDSGPRGARLKPGQTLQNVYDTRFITYLARFLLTFDPSANAWWAKQKLGTLPSEEIFAEFAESVEIGLADYFVGPYGSYSSIQAAKAGIAASAQVKSSRATDRQGFFETVKSNLRGKREREIETRDRNKIAKQGVLNLYTLLKARYRTSAAKKQLAILFSFFSNPDIQPTAEIRSLFGEIDDTTITAIDVIKPTSTSEATSRSSSRRGGGYTLSDPPEISIEAPPALGSSYKPAKAKPQMLATSRILRIRLLDGGAGYSQAPSVTIQGYSDRPCSACAILDRDGHVESIIVLDPGYGYASTRKDPPRVSIGAPRKGGDGKEKPRRARAVADLEYEVIGVEILQGGNGYVATEPPKVFISPPKEDPDWYVQKQELAMLESEYGPFRAEVIQMNDPNGKLVYSMDSDEYRKSYNRIPLDLVKNEPFELLPSTIRPELNSYGSYVIPLIAGIQTFNTSPNPRYRAFDPLFGAIGKVPVTKNANELKTDEYARLAVSGAVCTVLVRTALNPLELIKTKQQLQNDEELIEFTRAKLKTRKESAIEKEGEAVDETKIGSLDLIKNLAELRGPTALFQSSDITFLASLMFGSFGFGATELFRRSFTLNVFTTDGGDINSEVILLLAATAATIVTSAAASPFELLRVRSMGLVESKKWTEVLGDFVQENSSNGDKKRRMKKKLKPNKEGPEDFSLKDIQAKDLLPLFAGFAPTASRELAFAIPKFLAFDIIAKTIVGFINESAGPGSLPVQVGVGSEGLAISAISGALAGIAGAIVSHPADLILTYTSASKKKQSNDGKETSGADWRDVVKDLLEKEGGIANLFVGLQPRLVFFFLVIGLQFFLYDYVKILLQVGSDDLSLVLDVFYAVRQGLVDGKT